MGEAVNKMTVSAKFYENTRILVTDEAPRRRLSVNNNEAEGKGQKSLEYMLTKYQSNDYISCLTNAYETAQSCLLPLIIAYLWATACAKPGAGAAVASG